MKRTLRRDWRVKPKVRREAAILHRCLLGENVDDKTRKPEKELKSVEHLTAKRWQRQLMLQRHPFCSYCGLGLNEETATLDHIIPRSKSGPDVPENLTLSCESCNQAKANNEMTFFQLQDSAMSKTKLTPGMNFAVPESKCELVAIDKTMASEWLIKNFAANRPVRLNRVSRFAADMIAGNFRLTHQGIAFNKKGELVDGQHRLLAIIESDKTILQYVFRNLDDEALSVIDTGTSRSSVDAAHIAGKNLTPASLATLRWYVAEGGNPKSFTHSETLALLDKHEDVVRKVHELIAAPTTGKRHWDNGPVRGALARGVAALPESVMEDFVRRLREQDFSGASSVRALYNYSESNRDRGQGERRELFLRAQRAIQAFASGEQLKQLKAVTNEPFPLKV